MNLPYLTSDYKPLDLAWRIALGDIVGNLVPDQAGLLDEPRLCFRAGLDYPQQWTRDNALNAWNGGTLLFPEVARASLLAVLKQTPEGPHISGQYWDCIVWTIGAWHLHTVAPDETFLRLAFQASASTLRRLERDEWDESHGLFRGSALTQDGVAAFPDRYASHGTSGISDWPKRNPDKRVSVGFGLPMMTLSTNALYAEAYRLMETMAHLLGQPVDPAWTDKRSALREGLHRHLWLEEKGHYRFLADPWGGCDHQESAGHALVILFGLAGAREREAVFKNQYVAPGGVPGVWPSFSRYTEAGAGACGRHSGAVWPPMQALWAEAAARHGRTDLLFHELSALCRHAVRDHHFTEIYHPETGLDYGGLQEDAPHGTIRLWESCARQTWSATSLLRMVFAGLLGLEFDPEGVRFSPRLPAEISRLRLDNLPYRGARLEIVCERRSGAAASCRINGVESEPRLSGDRTGDVRIELTVAA